MSAVWVIKAGKKGKDQAFALRKKCAVMGWGWLRNLKGQRRERIKEALEKRNNTPAAARQKAGSILRFANDVKVGDLVILPLRDERGVATRYCAIGKVEKEYEYDGAPTADDDTRHRIPLSWLDKERLIASIDYPLRSQHTVYQVGSKDPDTHAKITALLDGKTFVSKRAVDDEQEDDSQVSAIADAEVETRVRIRNQFPGDEFSRVVQEILVAKGYTCVITQQSHDLGIDIIASKGDLGLDAPISVQVKNVEKAEGASVLAKFREDMNKQGTDKGIFVSWGGFKDEKKVKQRFFPDMRLWDADDIMRLIGEHYESFSEEFKRELPLRRVLLWDDSKEEAQE